MKLSYAAAYAVHALVRMSSYAKPVFDSSFLYLAAPQGVAATPRRLGTMRRGGLGGRGTIYSSIF
jgi:hypothetical protein